MSFDSFLKRRTEMRTSLLLTTFGLALGAVATSPVVGHAEALGNYRYCGYHTSSATECYFNTFSQCHAMPAWLGCIENPGYIGDADARAQASIGLYRRVRQ
jgi:hypothetical protein